MFCPGDLRTAPHHRVQADARCDSFQGFGFELVRPDERSGHGQQEEERAIEELTATNRDLKTKLSSVRGQLTKTETKLAKANARAERWKKEAAAHRTAASRSDARVERLQKKLERATAALKPVAATGPNEPAGTGGSVAKPTGPDGLTVPDKTWTVVQLRAEARARGLSGTSKKSKTQLLAALTRQTPKRRSERRVLA